MAIKVPVLPQPAEQWTRIGGGRGGSEAEEAEESEEEEEDGEGGCSSRTRRRKLMISV